MKSSSAHNFHGPLDNHLLKPVIHIRIMFADITIELIQNTQVVEFHRLLLIQQPRYVT